MLVSNLNSRTNSQYMLPNQALSYPFFISFKASLALMADMRAPDTPFSFSLALNSFRLPASKNFFAWFCFLVAVLFSFFLLDPV